MEQTTNKKGNTMTPEKMEIKIAKQNKKFWKLNTKEHGYVPIVETPTSPEDNYGSTDEWEVAYITHVWDIDFVVENYTGAMIDGLYQRAENNRKHREGLAKQAAAEYNTYLETNGIPIEKSDTTIENVYDLFSKRNEDFDFS
jgi:hypothetical protein